MDGQRRLPLVGRSNELATLRQVCARGSGVVFIEGSAGMGKTRLLSEAVAGSGWRCFRANGDEDGVLRPLGLIEALLPDVRPTMEDVLNHLESQVLQHGKVLLCADDVQWCDDRSAKILTAVVERAADTPLAVLLAARPTPRTKVVAQLLSAARRAGHSVVLRRLDDAAVEKLVKAMPQLRARAGAAAGHPFMLDHLARVQVAPAGDASLIGALPLTSSTLEVVAAASVAGEFSLRDLARVVDRPTAEVQRALMEAVDLGVLRCGDVHFAFAHDLWRDAFAETLAPPVRAAYHRDLAAIRLGDGASALDVASHLVAAAIPPDDELATWLRTAAREAAADDLSAAITLAGRAAAVAGGELQESIQADLASLLAWSDDQGGAVEVVRTLASRVKDPRVRCRVQTAFALALATAGRNAEGAREARAAIDTGFCTPAQTANLLVVEALGDWVREPGATLTLARAAEEAARRLAQPIAVASALVAQVRALDSLGRFLEMSAPADEAFAISQDVRVSGGVSAGWRAWIAGAACDAAIMSDRHGVALERSSELVQLARRSGSHANEADGLVSLVLLHAVHGRWEAALAEVAAWELLAAEHPRGARGMSAVPHRREALLTMVHLAAGRGDALSLAESWSTVAVGELEEGRAAVAQAVAAFMAGEHSRACGHMRSARAFVANGWRTDLAALRTIVGLVETAELAVAAAVSDDEDLLRSLVAHTEVMARQNAGLPTAHAAALLGQLATHPTGALIDRVERVVSSVAAPVSRRRLFMAAATAVQHQGHRRAADDLWAEARRSSAGLGSFPHDGSAGAAGWDSLTPAELRVVELVGIGLTNGEAATQLYLSRYTVETHLKRAFKKLSVRNRAELAALASSRRSV